MKLYTEFIVLLDYFNEKKDFEINKTTKIQNGDSYNLSAF